MYNFHINTKQSLYELSLDSNIYASAYCFWDKLPIVENGIVSNKQAKQIYITDVKSDKQGCGSLLMENIINHFKEKSTEPTRKGYNKKTLWLKVLYDNDRAIHLYKKYGFIVDDKFLIDGERDNTYQWMFKTL